MTTDGNTRRRTRGNGKLGATKTDAPRADGATALFRRANGATRALPARVAARAAWQDVPIPQSFDIRLLKSSSLPRGRFETAADAARIDESRVARLLNSRPDLAAEIERREEEGASAPTPISARDARRYRRYFIAELLRIANMAKGPRQIATIYMRAFSAGELHAAELGRAKAALRKTLERAGFKGAILIGGIEIAWLAKRGLWVLHCHLLAVGAPDAAWDALRNALPDARPAAALKVQALKDLAAQLSYCQKFNSTHMPGRRGPNGRARAYPLPTERLIEWAEWMAKQRFEDFGFLFGARRRGGHIALEPAATAIDARRQRLPRV